MPQGGGGIMDLQRSYATLLNKVMHDRRLSLDEVIAYLRKPPEKLDDEEWILLHKIFRRPKPTYMKGLTKAAQQFLDRRKALASSTSFSNKTNKPVIRPQHTTKLIDIGNIAIIVTARPRPSTRARKVQEAFGIVSNEFQLSLVKDLAIHVSRGEIILISGPSGSGKSLLLRAIRWLVASGRKRGRMPRNVSVQGVSRLAPVKVAELRSVPKMPSPIDLLKMYSLEEALRILASAGLAEPQLFVRPAGHMSVGQTYRLALALALAEKPDLLLIDEFCDCLDRYSAFAVCKRIRRAIDEYCISVIVATSTPAKVLPALAPNRVLVLSSNSESRWLTPSQIRGRAECKE